MGEEEGGRTSGPKTTSCLLSAFVKYERRFDGLSFSFPPLPFPPVAVAAALVRSCDVSSRMGSLGDGNGGGAELHPARAWRKKGMVEMSGESAHGFVREARSFSDRKSTRLNSSHSGESRMPSSA